MKLIFIRHAEPDYSIDSLTPKGFREAELLSHRMKQLDAQAYYVSSMGRAQDTAAPTMKALGREAVLCDWLREFSPMIQKPNCPSYDTICWDWLPQDWTSRPAFFDPDRWYLEPELAAAGVKEEYERVTSCLDDLLARHGYRRNGRLYDAVQPSNDTLVFFCHFGITGVFLGHLLGISPMVLWHGTCAAPTGITVVATEERRAGTASFRMLRFGDVSHLLQEGEPVSFMARFCECYKNQDELHDNTMDDVSVKEP